MITSLWKLQGSQTQTQANWAQSLKEKGLFIVIFNFWDKSYEMVSQSSTEKGPNLK